MTRAYVRDNYDRPYVRGNEQLMNKDYFLKKELIRGLIEERKQNPFTGPELDELRNLRDRGLPVDIPIEHGYNYKGRLSPVSLGYDKNKDYDFLGSETPEDRMGIMIPQPDHYHQNIPQAPPNTHPYEEEYMRIRYRREPRVSNYPSALNNPGENGFFRRNQYPEGARIYNGDMFSNIQVTNPKARLGYDKNGIIEGSF